MVETTEEPQDVIYTTFDIVLRSSPCLQILLGYPPPNNDSGNPKITKDGKIERTYVTYDKLLKDHPEINTALEKAGDAARLHKFLLKLIDTISFEETCPYAITPAAREELNNYYTSMLSLANRIRVVFRKLRGVPGEGVLPNRLKHREKRNREFYIEQARLKNLRRPKQK